MYALRFRFVKLNIFPAKSEETSGEENVKNKRHTSIMNSAQRHLYTYFFAEIVHQIHELDMPTRNLLRKLITKTKITQRLVW